MKSIGRIEYYRFLTGDGVWTTTGRILGYRLLHELKADVEKHLVRLGVNLRRSFGNPLTISGRRFGINDRPGAS